ncbi:MAG: hypothetical protein ABUK13_05325, partial [Gammaproteobacteria bacterium]
MFKSLIKKFKLETKDDVDIYTDRIHQAQVTRLIESSGFNNLVSMFMAVIWVALVWGDLPSLVLSVWLSMMIFLSSCSAIVQYFGLYKRDDLFYSSDVAKRWYLLAVIFVAMGWGVASTLMFPHEQIGQIILAFILVGVSASGISYSNVVWVYSAYVGFILVPLAVRLF